MPYGQFPQILAGQPLTAGLIQSIAPLSAWKSADTPRTSTVTLAADTDLLIPMAANANYLVFGVLYLTGAAIGAGDLQMAFTWPAGAGAWWVALGYNSSSTTVNLNAVRTGSGSASALGVNGGSGSAVLVGARCQCGTTAGSFQLEWAQNSSSSTATTMKSGSWLAALRSA